MPMARRENPRDGNATTTEARRRTSWRGRYHIIRHTRSDVVSNLQALLPTAASLITVRAHEAVHCQVSAQREEPADSAV